MLTPDALRQIETLRRAIARAPQSLLMLDYDGTLAPFQKNPEHAFPYPGVSEVLRKIIENGRTRVVIITGRDAKDVIPLLAIEPHPEVWGLHGLQRLRTNGSAEGFVLDEDTAEALMTAAKWLRYTNLQCMTEFKVGSVAVHWRGMEAREAESIREQVMRGWTPIAQDASLSLLEFDGGVEIRASHADKGDAVSTILNEMSPDTPAAYLGDDTTDEHAFEAMRGRGLSILVRPQWRSTRAQLWLRPPDEVLTFLMLWLRACRGRDTLNDDAALEVNA